MEVPRERIFSKYDVSKVYDVKMTLDYFQVRMPYKPIECILGNSYGWLKEPHRFRLTDETKVHAKGVKIWNWRDFNVCLD